MPNQDHRTQEERDLRRLRLLTDLTCRMLQQPDISLGRALHLIYKSRKQALTLFPNKTRTFDMIYGRRFARILETKGKLFGIRYPFWN